jgi:ribosomal protein S18 acetylase RimI-like enzyme
MKSGCRLLRAPEDYGLVGTVFDIFHHRLQETSRYYPSSKVRDHIERYTPHFFTDVLDGKEDFQLIGHITSSRLDGFLLGSDDSLRHLAYINWIMAGISGRGIGSELIEHFVEKCKKNGFNSIGLCVSAKNLGAIKLYEDFGFKVVSAYDKKRMFDMKLLI